jgi:ABC-type sugar transport system permease subunit
VITFVPLAFVVSFALAMLVRNHFKGIGWVRSAFFLPNVVSLVVVALIWQFLLVDKRGAISKLLAPLGLGDVSFLGTPSLALGTYVVISVWFLMGYQMLVFLAGLKDVPKELEDAAQIDGAGRFGIRLGADGTTVLGEQTFGAAPCYAHHEVTVTIPPGVNDVTLYAGFTAPAPTPSSN